MPSTTASLSGRRQKYYDKFSEAVELCQDFDFSRA
jgi:hypothetical protein